MAYIKRQLQESVLRLSKQFSVILITGPRQVGKTTMLVELMKSEPVKREYVTLDDLNERAMAKNDPAMFFQIHHPPVLIDEVQYAPELFPYIKIQVDKNHTPGEFWLTGSQIYKLMRGVQESLAGRVALLNLFSLSQSEVEERNEPQFTVELSSLTERKPFIHPAAAPETFERIWKGSMPAILSGAVEDRDVFYSAYLSTYIDRDVRELSSAIDSLKFLRFVTAVAARTGQLLNYKGIADDADIDQVTVKSWLNILETLGIIFYLHPYSNNVLKRTIKTPKLYFYDTGLVCYLTKWSTSEVAMNGAMSGALYENYVVSEIIKSFAHNAKTPYLYYYRDKDAKEIDLLIETDGKLHPVEIKKTAHPEKRMTAAFSVIDKTPLERGTGAVICLADGLSALNQDILIIPSWYI
jgi:predicted AAA+ superfamily ATPase